MFCEHGIDRSRIKLLPYVKSPTGHLDSYNKIDIALDPFPYNGTTTSCEALWMGVPFITKVGDRHCARVGMSLLKSVSLQEFIVESDEEYISKAIELSQDPNRLNKIKHDLRDKMLKSSICDKDAFCNQFSDAIRKMWSRWCQDFKSKHSDEENSK